MKSLAPEKRSMLFLFWIYEFANTTASIFINVFIYLRTESLGFLALFILMQFTGSFLGFVGVGYVIAERQYSMRWNYLRSFFIYFLGFICLAVLPHTTPILLIFAFFNGLGLGIFWIGNHSYEMLFTKNENGDRDFYSSILHGGTQLIAIFAPLVGTLFIFFSEELLHKEPFYLLFWFFPLIFLISIPFLFKLPHFKPPKIPDKEVRSFFFQKRERKIFWYYILTGLAPLHGVSLVLFSVLALETATRIGAWETIVGVVSFFVILFLAFIRSENNRLRIMLYATAGFFVAYGFLLSSEQSLYFYLAFSLIMVIFRPIYRVSQHTIDLCSFDLLAKHRPSFYSGILYRDTVLYIGRLCALIFIIGIAFISENNLLTAKISIILYMANLLAVWLVAKKMIEDSKDEM